MSKTIKVGLVTVVSGLAVWGGVSIFVFSARSCRAESPPVYTANTNVPPLALAAATLSVSTNAYVAAVTGTASATASALAPPTPLPAQAKRVRPIVTTVTVTNYITEPEPVVTTNSAPLIIQQNVSGGSKGRQVIYLNAVGQPRVMATDPDDTGVTNTMADARSPYLFKDEEDWKIGFYDDQRTWPVTASGAGCGSWQPTQPRRMFDPRLHESRMAEIEARRAYAISSASIEADVNLMRQRRAAQINMEANQAALEQQGLIFEQQRRLQDAASQSMGWLQTQSYQPYGYGGGYGGYGGYR